MINPIIIPGYHRVLPNLTLDDQQIVLLSLNGKASIGKLLVKEIEPEENVIKDYDGQLSAGQDVHLEMTETGKVKVSSVDKGTIPAESTACQELGTEAYEAIRKFDLAEHGGILRIKGSGADGLGEAIRKAGGRGPFTHSLVQAVKKAAPNLTVADHIVWQYYKDGDSIRCKAHIPSSVERIRFFSENLFNPKFNTTTPHVFFKEYAGEHYKQGLGNQRVLVLGESMFCDKDGKENRQRCPFFDICTSRALKNSSAFDHKCPSSDVPLSDAACDNVRQFLDGTAEGDITSYVNFTKLMEDIGLVHGKAELFDHIVFYDFLQFYSPAATIDENDLTERDDMAFEEILAKYNPTVIIIWGTKVANRIKKKGQFPPKGLQGVCDPNYVFSQKIAGRWRTFLSIYHPSDRYGSLSKTWEEHVRQARLIFK